MTFWLVMVTLFISIVYYSLYPRTDKVSLEQPIGEAAVVTLVSMHQGAKNYALQRMLGADYDPSYKGASQAFRPFPVTMVQKMRPTRGLNEANLTSDATLSDGEDGSHFVSVFACVNPDRNDQLVDDCIRASDKYIVTYGFQQDGWSERVRQKEYWRTAISNLTYNSNECGTLIRRDDLSTSATEYAVDTPHAASETIDKTIDGVEQTFVQLHQIVPPAITDEMAKLLGGHDNLPDMLICLTKWRLPYEQDGLVLHLDGINNNGSGHKTLGTNWVNLGINTADTATVHGDAVWEKGGLMMDGNNYVTTTMRQEELGNAFTISAVVRFSNEDSIKRGGLWGVGNLGRYRLIGGEADEENKVLRFGIRDTDNPGLSGTMLEVPFDKFRLAGNVTTPVQVTYVAQLSSSPGAAWHALFVDDKQIAHQSLNLTATAGDLGTAPLEFGRVNAASTLLGTLYNVKVYDRSLATQGCKKELKPNESGEEVYECTTQNIITDKRKIHNNFIWDKRRFGVGAALPSGIRAGE